jgi:hypothetical protein
VDSCEHGDEEAKYKMKKKRDLVKDFVCGLPYKYTPLREQQAVSQ